jgi:KaiC/GvpD/RAD55 family RecA-like ATPase
MRIPAHTGAGRPGGHGPRPPFPLGRNHYPYFRRTAPFEGNPIGAPMGLCAIEPLPPELADFLSTPGPQTLTVRGAPGVGKTTLALTALAGFGGRRAFVTTRVSSDAMLAQFPWLRLMLSDEFRLVEMVRYRGMANSITRSIEEMRRLFQDRASDLVDLSSVLSLPGPLVDVMGGTEGPRMIVIDSWDAWVENLIGTSALNIDSVPTRWELERSLIDQLLRTGAKVVLVVEREERTRFDYISDGNLLLASSEHAGRRERWLSVSKLRGTAVQNAEYPFTLFGARFRCMVPHLRPTPPAGAGVEPDPEPDSPTLWPGSSAFVSAFGRLPERNGILVETDLETSATILWTVVVPMIASVIAGGGRVLVRPPFHLPARELRRSLEAVATTGQLVEQVRVATPIPVPEDLRAGYLAAPAVASAAHYAGVGLDVALLTGPAREAEYEQLDPLGFLRGDGPVAVPSLVVLFLDGAIAEQVPHGLTDPFLQLPMVARQAGLPTTSLILGEKDEPLVAVARAHTAVHLMLQNFRGQFFLYGRRPWTPLYALTVPERTLGPAVPYGLLPMV